MSEPFKRLEKIMTVQDLPETLRGEVDWAATDQVRVTVETISSETASVAPNGSDDRRAVGPFYDEVRHTAAQVGYIEELPQFPDVPFDEAMGHPFKE